MASEVIILHSVPVVSKIIKLLDCFLPELSGFGLVAVDGV